MLLEFLLAVVSCQGETQCVGKVHNVSSTGVAEFDFLTENHDSGCYAAKCNNRRKININAKCNTNPKCNNIDAKCSTQNVIIFQRKL